MRDELTAGATPQVQAWVKAIDMAETRKELPGVVEALKAQAPPGVKELAAAILDVRKAMRAATTGQFAGLDQWLFDYGYRQSTQTEQEARKGR